MQSLVYKLFAPAIRFLASGSGNNMLMGSRSFQFGFCARGCCCVDCGTCLKQQIEPGCNIACCYVRIVPTPSDYPRHYVDMGGTVPPQPIVHLLEELVRSAASDVDVRIIYYNVHIHCTTRWFVRAGLG
jgi:hypothetical protein